MAKTIRELIDQARDFHHQLAGFYEKLGGIAEQERVRLLLDYMSRHEGHLEQCLREYEDDTGADVLESCMSFTPGSATCQCFEGIELKPDMSTSDVINTAMKLDDCLVRFYRQIAENATNPRVRALFNQLMDLEQAEERITVRNAIEVDDF